MKCGRAVLQVSALAGSFLADPALALERRTFVMSWWGQATNSTDGDCSKGIHPSIEEHYINLLPGLGYTPEQIRKLAGGGDGGDVDNSSLGQIMVNRGRINGKPVNAYAHPEAVADPNLPPLDGKAGYGFDLDGKGADDPDGFIDPETGQVGVDHQLYRALGCYLAHRGSLAGRTTYWSWGWGQVRDSQPAWLITLSGEDLSADGKVTITIDRALEYLRSNADSSPRHDVAYRVDPDVRSHNVFEGQIKDGVVTLTEPGTLGIKLMQNPLIGPEFRMNRIHLRMTLKPDRTAVGMMGGYQPWADIYFAFAAGSPSVETGVMGDVPATYHLMRKLADGDPDPQSGQNMTISATYYFEAVPAFAVDAGVPGPPGRPAAGRVATR
jgi:hypothetical protein